MLSTKTPKKCVGVVGCGNMGAALARGFLRAASGVELRLFDANEATAKALASELGEPHLARSLLKQLVEEVDVLFLAVKPSVVGPVVNEVGSLLASSNKKPLLVSVAAGVLLSTISKILGVDWPIVRVMPNLACEWNAGMFALYSKDIKDTARIEELLAPLGRVLVVNSDAELDMVTALSGSGPAFVFSFIEALSDAGVKLGIGRENSLILAAQSVFGASRMVLQSGAHPALLRDMVTSPGGTTIAGLYELEKSGMRAGVISAVEAAAKRACELGVSVKDAPKAE